MTRVWEDFLSATSEARRSYEDWTTLQSTNANGRIRNTVNLSNLQSAQYSVTFNDVQEKMTPYGMTFSEVLDELAAQWRDITHHLSNTDQAPDECFDTKGVAGFLDGIEVK